VEKTPEATPDPLGPTASIAAVCIPAAESPSPAPGQSQAGEHRAGGNCSAGEGKGNKTDGQESQPGDGRPPTAQPIRQPATERREHDHPRRHRSEHKADFRASPARPSREQDGDRQKRRVHRQVAQRNRGVCGSKGPVTEETRLKDGIRVLQLAFEEDSERRRPAVLVNRRSPHRHPWVRHATPRCQADVRLASAPRM